MKHTSNQNQLNYKKYTIGNLPSMVYFFYLSATHLHKVGQVLLDTGGEGWYQEE
jgi:hypothetical protein